MTAKKSTDLKNFDTDLKKLEDIVASLEGDQLGLEKSLELFEKGVELYSSCRLALDEVEKKVEVLTNKLEDQSGN